MVLPIVGGVTYCWWCYLLLVVLPIVGGVTYCWLCYLLFCWKTFHVDNLGMYFNGVFLNVSLNSEKSETKIFVITETGSLN